MKCWLLPLGGAALGAIAGAVAGILLGVLSVELFDISCFEGYCGFVVGFCFLPLGLLLGAAIGGVFFYRRARS
ncbi:MAG: hypothetical protein Fur0044_48790 [Anaerolineae bacterium]